MTNMIHYFLRSTRLPSNIDIIIPPFIKFSNFKDYLKKSFSNNLSCIIYITKLVNES